MLEKHTRLFLTAGVLTLGLGLAGCPSGDDDSTDGNMPQPTSPTINDFSANLTTIASGGMVTITYDVTNASMVQIDANGGDQLLAPTATLSGTVMTGALTVSTTYTLTARGVDGAAPVTRDLTITVMAADQVMVNTFTANPATIDAGDSSTLTWQTTNADSVEITDDQQNTVVMNGMPNGSMAVTPGATTVYTIVATGANGMDTATTTVQVNTPVPVINSFMAMPAMILERDSTMLVWNVSGATSIVIADAGGTEVFNGNMGMGTQMVGPLSNTTTYTLTATNQFGPATAMTTVTVNPRPSAMINSFMAAPTTVDTGRESVLSWDVIRAPQGITIVDGTGATATTSASNMGSITVTPTVTTSYTLNALNMADGDAMQTITVTVNAAAPEITTFTAAPNPGGVNLDTNLSWTTLGADTVRILRVVPNPAEIVAMAPVNGQMMVTLTSTRTTFMLEATNSAGVNMMPLVVDAQNAPTIDTLDVSPETYIGTATTATVTWSTTDAVTVGVEVDGMVVSTATAGTMVVNVMGTVDVTVTATSAGGVVSQSASIVSLATEMEPNDTATTAPAFMDGAAGEITAGDEDWYAVTVTVPGSSIFGETSNGRGGCDTDTRLDLYDTDGTTQLGTDDDGGPGVCSQINPNFDQFARNLMPGTYYLRVRGFGANTTGTYVLVAEVIEPECGNGVVEGLNNEQCDDGNVADGDNCSATCQIPIEDTIQGPTGQTVTIADAIAPVGDFDTFQINMAADGYIFAETFAAARPTCDDANTVLRLFDDMGNQLVSDFNDGEGNCSRIDISDAGAFVMAGTYFLRVEESGNNAEIAAYTVEIRTVGQGCGNGILESAMPFGETCDDGNTNSGDGCDNLCQFEGQQEVEMNDTFDVANTITTTTSAIISGQISPVGDNDFYAINIPVGWSIEAYITVDSLNDCPTNNPRVRVALFQPNGTTQITSSGFSGYRGNCGMLTPLFQFSNGARGFAATALTNVGTGETFFLRVREDGDNAEALRYFLHVTLLPPECGNDIIDNVPTATIAEQCDGGNAVSGDGCGPTCDAEVAGAINPPGGTETVNFVDENAFQIYQVNITTPGQSITATTSDGAGMCNIDTTLQLVRAFSPTQLTPITPLGTDTGDGPGDCAAISPFRDAFATGLSTGTYGLIVSHNAPMGGSVQLDVVITDPGCGNGLHEPANNEQCDDGNRIDGDGCSMTCEFEPVLVYTAPGMTVTATRTLNGPDGEDVYRIDVTADAILSASTDRPGGGCASIGADDYFMELRASDLTTVLGSDDDDGPGWCPAINPSDAFAQLAPGSYFLIVNARNRGAVMGDYVLTLSAVAGNVCGNGITEAGNNETCDDGNMMDGDGCSAMCQLEMPPIMEAEPNDDTGSSNMTGLNGPGMVTIIGDISAAPDLDYYVLDVPMGGTITAQTYGMLGNLNSCGGDTQLSIRDTADMELVFNDDGGNGVCSLISNFAVPAAGQYFVRVNPWSGVSTYPVPYIMDITVQ